MKKLLTLNKVFLFSIFFLVILLDFSSKRWIINNLLLFEIHTLNPILNIFHIHNYGLAFGLLSETSQKYKYFLLLVDIITIAIILKIIYLIQINKKYYSFAYTLIISGAIGNMIDRLYFGFVIDFIDIHFNNWHFATFNVADISIFLGSILIIYIYFLKKEKK